MPVPDDRRSEIPATNSAPPRWQAAQGTRSHLGESLCWVWLKVLGIGFVLACAVGLVGLSLGVLCS